MGGGKNTMSPPKGSGRELIDGTTGVQLVPREHVRYREAGQMYCSETCACRYFNATLSGDRLPA